MKKVYFHTSEDMHEIPDEKARIVIASPPFTNNLDGKTLDKQEYLSFLSRVFQECFRILVPGGVLVSLNTDLRDHARYNQGDRSYERTIWMKHADIRQLAGDMNYKFFDYKIWVKSLKQNMYRLNFSHILFFSKPVGRVFRNHPQKHTEGYGPSVWLLEDSMQRRDSKGFVFRDAIHPEISRRCIREYTRKGDLVVSPFAGSGTILATAEELGRDWVGYEINKSLERLIRESIHGPVRPRIYNT